MVESNEKCLCEGCPRRFICFTQKRVFSDPAYQALYEAYCESGVSHEDAVKKVLYLLEQQLLKKSGLDSPWKNYRLLRDWHDVEEPSDEAKVPGWWTKSNWYTKELGDAKTEIKDLKRYFRSMIRGEGKENSDRYDTLK